jgi:gliding motility-associated-like protein
VYEIMPEDISCFGENNGSLQLLNISGGVAPFGISLDNSPFQPGTSFQNLSAGNHQVMIMDQNGCTTQQNFTINEPADWSLELGKDTTLVFGTTFNLQAVISGSPQGTLQYTWSDHQCDNCVTRSIAAISTIEYRLTVTDENGCSKEDAIKIAVVVNRNLFIPNIFSPNGDQVNDLFIISSASLEIIEELTIFDRWGNILFQKFNFQPNDPAYGWDGNSHGKSVNPGVFAYKAIVRFKDGSQHFTYGDVTLIR